MLNVTMLNCWETSSKREGEQRKSRVVDSRLSGGNSLSPVLELDDNTSTNANSQRSEDSAEEDLVAKDEEVEADDTVKNTSMASDNKEVLPVHDTVKN